MIWSIVIVLVTCIILSILIVMGIDSLMDDLVKRMAKELKKDDHRS